MGLIRTPVKSWDWNALNSVVLWCLLVFVFSLSGFGLYRQHRLELRILVLEEQLLTQKTLKVEEVMQPEEILRRETRDAECICPADIEQNAHQNPVNEPARAGEDLQPADASTGETLNKTSGDKTSPDQAVNNQESATVPDLDPEILSALGEVVEDTPKFGEKIHDSLAKIWQPILRKGLNKDTKEKVLKQYLVPENCTLLQAPKLNPEISAAVSDPTRSKDKRVEAVQQQLGLGITALNRGLALLLDSDKDRVQAIKHISDSCRILCDLHFGETEARKKFITPGLDKAFLNVINEVDRDEMLFGNKLSEKIKASKVIEKQGLQIKKPAPTPKPQPSASTSTSSSSRSRPQGNWSAPPRYSSNKGGGGKGGSKKTTSANRKTPTSTQSKSNTTKPRAPTHL